MVRSWAGWRIDAPTIADSFGITGWGFHPLPHGNPLSRYNPLDLYVKR